MNTYGDVPIAPPSAEPATDAVPAPATQPAIAYRTGPRTWPWDVRVIAMMGVVWAALQILQSAGGIFYLVRQRNFTWFGSGYNGWMYVLGVLLRSILPCLLIVGLIGLLRFKRGARRMSALVAGTFAVFGVVEIVAQGFATLAQRPYAYEVPGHVAGLAQAFFGSNALMLVLLVTLLRADVRLLADDVN